MEMSRKCFLGGSLAMLAAMTAKGAEAQKKEIWGLKDGGDGKTANKAWTPFSDKKVRVGIAGEGVCSFGSAFGWQNHPNAVVAACCDVVPKNRDRLMKRVGNKETKVYNSCEEMIKNAAADKLDCVYIATDAASHVQLAIMALEHGLHVASAVPALLGKEQLDYVPKLIDAVKRNGKIYYMNETSAFRASCYAMRKLYEAGMLGNITYTEGEYFHSSNSKPNFNAKAAHGSYNGWREGLPPQYYPTHSNGYYTCVTHKRFVKVSCTGVKSLMVGRYSKNRYDNNPFGSEYAMFQCEDGSASRMLVHWDTPSYSGEDGRIWGQKGCYIPEKGGYRGWFKDEVSKMTLSRPKLPPGMPGGGHGGSHGYLTDDFIRSILVKDHKPCVDVYTALNTTVAGIYAHMSAVKDGERLAIPEL